MYLTMYWYGGVMLFQVLWLAILSFWGSRAGWRVSGITRLSRWTVISMTTLVMVVEVLTGIVSWIIHGSFHPVFMIIVIVGLVNIDPIRWALRWPEKVSSI